MAEGYRRRKKGSKLSVFLYQRENIEAAVKAFEKKYPEIQVITASTPAAETGARLMAERRAGKFLWDVCICGPTTPFSVLYPAKALDPIKPALMLPEVVDQSKWWEGKHHYMDAEGSHIFVFLGSVDMPNVYYNKNMIEPNVEWLHGVFRNYAAQQTGRTERQRKRIHHQKIAFDLAPYGIIKRRLLEGETEEADDWKIGHWLVFPSVQKGPDMLRFRVPIDDTRTAQWYFSIHPLEGGRNSRR